jgi:subtilisin family serine protease
LLVSIVLLGVSRIFLAWPALVRAESVSPNQASERFDDSIFKSSPAGQPERLNLLVHIKPKAKRGPVRTFANQRSGNVRYEYKTVMPNVINLRNIPATAVKGLQNIPGVIKVEKDVYHPNLIKLDESTPLIRGLQSQIAGAGYSIDGTGIRVCVCDTGIDMDHIMYSSRIDTAACYDFVNNDSSPDDDYDHGAHVAGISVGGTGLTINLDPACDGIEPLQGVAPGATLIGVKVIDESGGGYDSDIIAGIDHCADQSTSGGRADVINLSLGLGEFSGTCDSESVAAASNNAVALGVVVVAASGNEGNANALCSPACASGVISVGATYKADYPRCEDPTDYFTWCLDWLCLSSCTDTLPITDDVACFSNNSDYLDVTAPGVKIWSASIEDGGDSFIDFSGTSMASPQVAGLVALILSRDPSMTPAEVRQCIRDGAIDLGPSGFDRGYGYGRIDVINSLDLVNPSCESDSECDDHNACTTDICNTGTGECSYTTFTCDDGDPCTNDSCNPATGECVFTYACDDGNPCTDDACDPNTGECTHTNNNASCEDGNLCTLNDTCAEGVCVSGSEKNCDDVDACTTDTCDPLTGGCNNTPVTCNDSNPCTDDSCDPSTGDCVFTNNNASCDDGNPCTINDSCSGGTCSDGIPKDCDDQDACTTDNCNLVTGECYYTQVTCDDGNPCTDDSCDVPMIPVIRLPENVSLPITTHLAMMEIHVHSMMLAQEGRVPVDLQKTAMISMPAPRITATL